MLWLLSTWLLGCTCADAPSPSPAPPAVPVPEPADGTPLAAPAARAGEVAPPIVPLFLPPFRGELQVSGTFDHSSKKDVDRHRQQTGWGTLTYGRGGHRGHDVVMKVGTPLYAMADGVVVNAGDKGPTKCNGVRKPSDVRLRIEHDPAPDGHTYQTLFLHLKEVMVEAGDRVEAGQLVALSGNTGCSSGPHLHFGVRRKQAEATDDADKDSVSTDPWGWWSPEADPWAEVGGPSHYLWKERPETRRELVADKESEQGSLRFDSMINATWRDRTLPNGESLVLGLPGVKKKKKKKKKGSVESVDLAGYTLTNKAGDRWTFPARVVRSGERVTLRSGKGTDTVDTLFLGRDTEMWDDAIDCATLRAPDGTVVDRFPWGRKDELPCGAP